MRGVILDADSLGTRIDLSPLTSLLDDWDIHGLTQPEEIADRVANAEVILSNKIVINAETLNNHPGIRLISIMATGTNNVDLEAATQQGIIVSNAVAYATPSVVQHTMGLMLALATNQYRYQADVRAGAWQHAPAFCLLDHPIVELGGKKLGIIGHGELGSSVARVARAFGMEVLVASRTDGETGRTPLDELLASADIVSLHCPLTSDNKHLINRATLAQMKPSAFLVNTARGGLVHSEDLIHALNNGVIAGAAIDVLDIEPPTGDEPLLTDQPDNLIVTPHNAWGALESRQRLIGQMADNITQFLAGTPIRVVSG